MTDDLTDSTQFAQSLGRHTFIATRKSDGYRYLCSVEAQDRDAALAILREEHNEAEWTIARTTT